MSFDLFLQSFQNGKPCGIPDRVIRECFGPYLRDESPDVWDIRYDELNSSTIFISRQSDGTITSLNVNRPCVDLRLWDALFRILMLGNVVFHFPGDSPPSIAQPEAADHLPPEMIDAIGTPAVVTSGKDLAQLVRDG